MALFSRDLGQISDDPKIAVQQLSNYIAYMNEQLEFNDSGLKKRVKVLENKEGI